MCRSWSYVCLYVSRFNRSGNRCHFGTSSFLQSRLKTIRERAEAQNVDWIRSVEATRSSIPPYMRGGTNRFIDKCHSPFRLQKEPEEHGQSDGVLSDVPEGYAGHLESMHIEGFGSISVEHADILKSKADCVLIPVPPNLTPYSGIGLRVLECGGKKLITALMKRAKVLIAERLDALEKVKAEFKNAEAYTVAVKHAKALNIGDVILTPPYGAAEATLIAFVVTPWFWENSRRDATLKLRYIVKTALENLNCMRIRNVLCPTITDSLNGFEPRYAVNAMVEEAYDVLTQVDAIKPEYHLKDVHLVHRDRKEALRIRDALVELAHSKRPELQVEPAPVHFSRASQRIIEFDESVLKFCSQYRKITYKRHSNVRKSKRKNWLRNLKPFVWRASRMYEPPPLFVYKSTGLPASRQLPPRPYYKDKLSHVLFPLVRQSIKGLKLGKDGNWKAQTKPDPIYVQTKAF